MDLEGYSLRFEGVTDWYQSQGYREPVIMSSATSAVTYTSVYTDSKPGRAFWGADDEEPVALPSPNYILGPEDPPTSPVPQDEDELEFLAEEQPLPPVDSPTAESSGHVTDSDLEEDLKEYEDDDTKDGPVDYPSLPTILNTYASFLKALNQSFAKDLLSLILSRS
ncbi:hypothetical protein Tco_1089939 [Tanacetum coccineum]|uniref:Uncharacterized protein n=1 Tax=Tanacetum coccineum TaxID=301880 RepID=A0ABQ5I3X5_9ASTR